MAEIKVLVVDDDEGWRLLIPANIEIMSGYPTVAVGTVAEAVETVAHDPNINVVVTDYELLDGETGLDVIRRLTIIRPRMIFILFSGSAHEKNPGRLDPIIESEAFKAGAVTCVFKPDGLPALLRAITVAERLLK